jgi:hypothetical protein
MMWPDMPKSVDVRILAVILVVVLSFFGGKRYGEQELIDLLELPVGAASYSSAAERLFWKGAGDDFQTIRWKHIPNPEEAKMVKLFATPTTTPPSTVPPPTLPVPAKKEKGK